MKRLLMINSRFFPIIGGGETYTADLISYLSKKFEVHLLTNRWTKEDFRYEHFFVHYVEGFSDTNIALDVVIPEMKRCIDNIRPDLVHVHNIMPFYVYSSITLRNEYPTVLTIHNTPDGQTRLFGNFGDFRSEIQFCRSLFESPHCDALVFGSSYYRTEYLKVVPEMQHVPEIYVNHYFTKNDHDLEQLHPSAGRPEILVSVKILFPSRVLKRKGIEETLIILSRLPHQFSLDIPALAYENDSAYKNNILSMINDLGLAERVSWPEKAVPPDEMVTYYSKADIVLIPSHYEGFGIVAIEALRWGVPIITTCAGGLGEIVTHNYNGIKIDLTDIDDAVNKVVHLCSDVDFRNSLIMNGYKSVIDSFSHDRHMQSIDDIYREVLRNADRL